MLTEQEAKTLENCLLQFSKATQDVHSWVEAVISHHKPIRLPVQLLEYDPDPDGAHKFSDQRRLDTAFTEYLREMHVRIKAILEMEH